MKRVIFVLCVLFLIACKKSEVAVTPPVVVVPEEAVKFSTNLDTGTYYVCNRLLQGATPLIAINEIG
jgi:hypothetical protein